VDLDLKSLSKKVDVSKQCPKIQAMGMFAGEFLTIICVSPKCEDNDETLSLKLDF